MALDAYINNAESTAWNYNNTAVASVYNGHLNELERIESKKSTSYHAILHKIFSNCMYVFCPFSVFHKNQQTFQHEHLSCLRPRHQAKEDRL